MSQHLHHQKNMLIQVEVKVEVEGQSLVECLDRYALLPLLLVQRII